MQGATELPRSLTRGTAPTALADFAPPPKQGQRCTTRYDNGKPGDTVEYYSQSHQQWMTAEIQAVKLRPDGNGIESYDLNVKRKADPWRVRRCQAPAGAEPPNTSTPAPPAAAALSLEVHDRTFTHYQVGDLVWYNSETHKQEMHAVVQKVVNPGLEYDLDIKCRAKVENMRPRTSDVSNDHNYAPSLQEASASIVPVTQTQEAHRQRGASPLSGRGRVSVDGGGLRLPAGAVPILRVSSGGGSSSEAVAADEPPGHCCGAGKQFGAAPLPVAGPQLATLAGAVGVSGASARPIVNGGSLGPISVGGYATQGGAQLPPGANVVSCTVSSPTKVRGGVRSVDCSPVAGKPLPPSTTMPQQQVVVNRQLLPANGGATIPAVGSTAAATSAARSSGGGTTPTAIAKSAARANGGTTPPRRMVVAAARHSMPLVPPGSSARAVQHRTAIGVSGQPLELDDLQMGPEGFNPLKPPLRQQLLTKLGLPQSASISPMQGFRGGLNEGVWFVKALGSREELVLKLVRCNRIAPNVLTEAENFSKIYREHPQVIRDPAIAFPVKIFRCVDRANVRKHDLIVMRKTRGERLAEWIARKWYASDIQIVLQIFEFLGVCLAEFHARYGNAQHGDFQPSNIFYDEDSGDACFIDIGGMGVPTMETDVEHFVKSLNLLAETYGQQLAADGRVWFEQGYHRAATR